MSKTEKKNPTSQRKPKNVKQENEKKHARQRFLERYGIVFNREKRLDVITQIRTGASQLLSKTSQDYTVHMVIVEGRRVPVVYDKKRHEIVTCLPMTDDKVVQNEEIYA